MVSCKETLREEQYHDLAKQLSQYLFFIFYIYFLLVSEDQICGIVE